MKNNLSEKVLYLITLLLFVVGFFLSFVFYPKKSWLFFFIFLLIYWQRKRLQDFFRKKTLKASWAAFILAGWVGAIFLEFSLEISPFHPKPLANYFIGLGFYLPYFAIWRKFIKDYQYSFFEIFYLSGFGRLVFDLVITRKLLIAAFVTTNPLSALLVFFSQAVVTLVLFGMLTTLPALCLTGQENKSHSKPLREYLVGLGPGFLAAGVFIVWTIILKAVFT